MLPQSREVWQVRADMSVLNRDPARLEPDLLPWLRLEASSGELEPNWPAPP